jgi:hypothetical protein
VEFYILFVLDGSVEALANGMHPWVLDHDWYWFHTIVDSYSLEGRRCKPGPFITDCSYRSWISCKPTVLDMHGNLFASRGVDVNNLAKGSGNLDDRFGLKDEISASNIHLPGVNQFNHSIGVLFLGGTFPCWP